MMTDKRSLLDVLHEATHRLPGVPDHANQTNGHQGNTRRAGTARAHGSTARASTAERRQLPRTWNHSPARPPRVLVAWQRRIAAVFGQELR